MSNNFKPTQQHNKTISIVLMCHFISAASTLGIAPFFSLILSTGFQKNPSILVGFIYILPTFLTALFSPVWGKIADRINKKSALLRAQSGLALSFLVAAFSRDHLWLFILSLCAQGILGGTLAAANA
ncbi:MAG: MFS family permease, partial [Francisellaceae bacterium]